MQVFVYKSCTGQIWNYNTTKKKQNYKEYFSRFLTYYWIFMIHIMMDIDEHQDKKYTWGDNVGRDLYLLGVNVLVFNKLFLSFLQLIFYIRFYNLG